MTQISPQQCLAVLRVEPGSTAVIDVRSPVEFGQGSLPGAINLPILHDEHRHLVGVCYREQGQAAAVELGQRLVHPILESIVEAWQSSIARSAEQRGVVFCWRGGMRSQIAQQLLSERGFDVPRVSGGYKAMRRECLNRLSHSPSLLVIGGMTGCGKTLLLREFEAILDLERLAHHRGSAFGGILMPEQPTQLNFENSIAVQFDGRHPVILVEDESRTIGRCAVPNLLHEKMASAPTIVVEDELTSRAGAIYDEYVLSIRDAGFTADIAVDLCTTNLYKISKRLGGALTQQIDAMMREAFAAGFAARESHVAWIGLLLSEYYDRQYQHSMTLKNQQVLFSGPRSACKDWLKEYLHEAK